MADTKNETEDTKTEFEELQEQLKEIKDQEGIIGYILRDQKSASIDLKDPRRIVDYAVLSSTAFDASHEITEVLQTGEPKKMVLESEETKLLLMNVNNHRLSLFMEKDVNHNKLYKKLK